MKQFFFGCLLAAIFLSCSLESSDYRIDNPSGAFRWIGDNFLTQNVGYKTVSETIEIRTGDCYTLSMLFCHLIQDAHEPEIVVGVIGDTWHTVAKVNGVYYDLGMRCYGKLSPFPGYSISMPWRLADCYRWYAKWVEKID